jgi:hypothetical protein
MKVASIDTRMYVSCVPILLETTFVSRKYEGDIYCSVIASAIPFEPSLIRQLHKQSAREQLRGSLYDTEAEEWWGGCQERAAAGPTCTDTVLSHVQNSMQQHFLFDAMT